MPVYTYPGVYIEEVPSGVHPIAGVATSVTAFVGATQRGQVNQPIMVDSYGAFERAFGPAWPGATLPVAVRDFFVNGGSQALIVRLYSGDVDAHTARLAQGSLHLRASSPGTWGNKLRARVSHLPDEVRAAVADTLGLQADKWFDLTVRDMASGAEETFANLTLVDHPRRVDRVLAAQSQLVRVDGELASGLAPVANSSPAPRVSPWADDHSSQVDPLIPADPLLDTDDFTTSESNKTGIYALLNADLFNLLCLPPYTANDDVEGRLLAEAARLCARRRAILLVDPPNTWRHRDAVQVATQALTSAPATPTTTHENAALFFPMIRRPDPLRGGMVAEFVPSGAVAGVIARTDAERGVWKAPAGLGATLLGVPELSVPLSDPENGRLNQLGVNCLRVMPGAGPVVWGARTRRGDDRLTSEWKYLPVRRLALFIEESLYRGTHWVVFEPNDEPLWTQIRLNVGAFMQDLFRRGAFEGRTPREAYFVKCDAETTTPRDRDLGIVNILVGFAPVKPAEFVVIRIQQQSGQGNG